MCKSGYVHAGVFQKTENQVLENCFTDERVVPRGMKWAQSGVPVGVSWSGSPWAQCLSWAAWRAGVRRQALPSPKARDSSAGHGLRGSALSSGGTLKLRPQWARGERRDLVIRGQSGPDGQ